MEIKLIGPLDYEKVNNVLKENINGVENISDEKINNVLSKLKDVASSRRAEVVSTAARLSRFPGDTLEVLNKSESMTREKNSAFINRVIGMGHTSIIDHDYFVFAIKDVSAIVEQTIIEERYSSFTIKSRREVDFSKSGYYVPDFHDENGKLIDNNNELRNMYVEHMDKLFGNYSIFVNEGIPKEDARFCLPYSFYSNILMGVDAHVLVDMIIKFTKTKYSKITELREFGQKLYDIVKEDASYLIPYIDNAKEKILDPVDEYLSSKIEREPYNIIDHVTMLNSPKNVDYQIFIAAIMRRYQYSLEKAVDVYCKLMLEDKEFRYDLMKNIAFEGDRLELSQVNFDFQIPVSYAILTHFTRHRTHKLMVPDFSSGIDLMQYKIPPKIRDNNLELYQSIFEENKSMYDKFKSLGVRNEDLVYFTLSGNMTNIITNMDGWTVRHILELRECNKAQWETRDIARGIHKEIKNLTGAEVFSKVLGSTCVTQGYCHEGKECCGKIYTLKK